MKFATNATEAPKYGSMSGPLDGKINYRNRGEHAERKHRQIKEEISTCDTAAEVDEVLDRHDEILDALSLDFPDYLHEIRECADEWKAMLRPIPPASGAPVIAQSTATERKTPMFALNKTEGSRGPWMTWSSNGSAEKGVAPKSWVMRGKDANDVRFENAIEGFANKCVFDLDTLKLGWEKDTANGPERVYSSHFTVPIARPDETKQANGKATWTNCLQVRVAISQDQAVTWEQGSFGAYEAFTRLSRQIEAQWDQSQNGKLLPLVQMTDVESQKLTGGTSNIPILTVVGWTDRPDILKDDAPAIATNAAPAPAPAAASSIPAGAGF